MSTRAVLSWPLYVVCNKVSMILFRNVSLSRGKSTTRFAGSPFFPEKSDNFHWT